MIMKLVFAALLQGCLSLGSTFTECPTGMTGMAIFNYSMVYPMGENFTVVACEDLTSSNGSVTFVRVGDTVNDQTGVNSKSTWPLTLQKRLDRITTDNDDQYLNFTKEAVLNAATDIMGAAFLALPLEVTLSQVMGAMPPSRNHPIWTANRVSGRDATFGPDGANWIAGTPSPQQASKVLKHLAGKNFDHEGLLGGDLPILMLNFPTNASSNSNTANTPFWEMSIVPQQRNTGNEQPIFIRFLQMNGSSAPSTLYFDSFAYFPSACASDALAGCDAPSNYFSAVLDTHFFWKQTWESENRMGLNLPTRPQDTDGDLLTRQASHAIVRDMITRTGDGVWPRYGTLPGYDQGGIGADGFQEIFTASMMVSLEWGMFEYAQQVLDNWLTYFVKSNGFVLYRGLEMAQSARMLTNIAQYFKYTKDQTMIVNHLDKIVGIASMLIKRRADAIKNFPVNDSRHGMPTGNDEGDLAWATVQGLDTELAFISIAAEMWRGLRDCSEALFAVANITGRTDIASAAKVMADEVDPLLVQLRKSMSMDANGDKPRCFPYVAGTKECGMLNPEASNRDSEPWRTYAEAMYSGALDPTLIQELYEWHQTKQGSGVKGSRLKLGVLSGCGDDVSCGDSFETFTIHGWGYGLLQADLIEAFLLQYYAISSHAYTRGTFIAPESMPLDRNHAPPSFATPAGVTAPIYLKWMLVWEDPIVRSLWFGKAVPRVWLSQGEVVKVTNTSTAYGRVSMSFTSAIESSSQVMVALTLPSQWALGPAEAPPGGVRVRVRVPEGRVMTRVMVGGTVWEDFNATAETISITALQLSDQKIVDALKLITISYTAAM